MLFVFLLMQVPAAFYLFLFVLICHSMCYSLCISAVSDAG